MPGISLPTLLAYYLYFLTESIRFEKNAAHADTVQRKLLKRMISKSRNTVWGRKYGYKEILSSEDIYKEFSKNVPLCGYEDLKGYFDRMFHGERDILWPGGCRMFAVTSSTTSSLSKNIPILSNNLKDTHFRGSVDSTAAYLRHRPDSRVFSGRTLIIPAYSSPERDIGCAKSGSISTILFFKTPRLFRLFKSPSPEVASIPDFVEKLEAAARETASKHITAIAGQPPWILELLKKVLEVTGKKDITEVWPDLEVFFYGGMPFDFYRPAFERLIPSAKMEYVETYNASEGFFGFQTSPDDSSLSLCIDSGVFYEFIPFAEYLEGGRNAMPVWKVSTGIDYVLVISTTGGLWRFIIGDVIRFSSLKPYKFSIIGRTAQFLNLRGERINSATVTAALAAAGKRTGSIFKEFTVAPEILPDGNMRLILLVEPEVLTVNAESLAGAFDDCMKELLHEYGMVRSLGTVKAPRVIEAGEGAFRAYMESAGRLDAQYKIPRISESRELIDRIMKSDG